MFVFGIVVGAIMLAAPLAPLPGTDAAGIDAYLQRLNRVHPAFEARLTQVLADTAGTPYVDGPLGEGPAGTHDTDPLFDLGRVDCVTEVEQAIALAASRDFPEFIEQLQRIRYRNGVIDFEARNHFMITDWAANNPFCSPLSEALGVPTESVTRTISRKGFFDRLNAPGLGLDTPDQAITLDYIPSAAVEDAERALPNGSLVVFVGRKPDWLFALHCGVFIRDVAGRGRLVEASSKHGAVILMDLGDYVREQGDRYLGFTAYRIGNPNPGHP